MTNETEDNREPQGRGISAMTVAVWFFGVLPAAYVLSIGPVVAVLQKLGLDGAPLRLFYAPLIALHNLDFSSWFARCLDWWFELWGVH